MYNHDHVFELHIDGLRYADCRAFHLKISRFCAVYWGNYLTIAYRLRPSPIAASIFVSVADAIAFALMAPSSRIASNLSDSINS